MERTDQQPAQHSPNRRAARAQAVQDAARAADAHAANPDTTTLRTMQTTVQTALNLGAAPDDIRAARTGVTA